MFRMYCFASECWEPCYTISYSRRDRFLTTTLWESQISYLFILHKRTRGDAYTESSSEKRAETHGTFLTATLVSPFLTSSLVIVSTQFLAFLLCRNIRLDETELLVWHSAYTSFRARRDYVTVIHREHSFPQSLKGVYSWHCLYYRLLSK